MAGPGGRGAGGAGGRRRREDFRALTINNNNGNLGRPGARLAPDPAGPWGFPLLRPELLGAAGQSSGVPAGNWCRSARPPRGRPSPPPRRLPGTRSRAPASGGGGARTGLRRAAASSAQARPRAGGGGGGRAGVPHPAERHGRRAAAEAPRLPPASAFPGTLAGAGGGGAVPSSRRAAGTGSVNQVLITARQT